MIFDYQIQKEWKYIGNLPCMIDFYADWCKSCRSIAQASEDLAVKYNNKLIIYKVDTEAELELANLFRIQTIPALLFVHLEEQPKRCSAIRRLYPHF